MFPCNPQPCAPWMHTQWGYTAPDLTVVAVSVYPAAASCSSSCGGSGDAPQGRPVRTVYVPQFSA